MAEALERVDVVFTCRTYEYNNYLQDTSQSAPRLDKRIAKLNMPGLSPDEIIAWARAYIELVDHRAAQEEGGFLRSLRGGIDQNGPLRQVCSVPVRLALTCETFAASQHVPEDLTVTDLYDSYWEARIRRDKGRAGTADGDAKEQAALDVASRTVTSEGNIALHVPKGQIDLQHLHGLRLLASEGVLHDLGTVWEFFHQTFAEYSYARWLLTQGIASGHIRRLNTGLHAGQTGLWPVVRSLLLQIPDDTDYQAIANQLQLVGPEGAYTQALAALRRIRSQSLQTFMHGIKEDPQLLAAALPALADAPPRYITTAIDFTSDALVRHAASLSSAAAFTLSSLLPRSRKEDLPILLNRALGSLIAVRGQLPSVTWEHLTSAILMPLIDVSDLSESLPVLWSNYESLSGAARLAIVRIHLARSLSAEETVEFAQRALGMALPSLKADEATRLLELFWNCHGVREMRGWRLWRDLLSAELPRDWEKAQTNFVAQMGSQDEQIGQQIVDDLLEGRPARASLHVQVFKKLVEARADWVASVLLSHRPPSETLAAAGIAEGISSFGGWGDSGTRTALISWLKPCRMVAARNIWPAQIILASNSVPAHQEIFNELMAANEPQRVFDSALDAWLFHAPVSVLTELTPQFRGILRGHDARTRGTRARLEGRLVLWDEEARSWIAKEVLHGSSPRIAGTAIKTVIDTFERVGERVPGSICRWLVTLIYGSHTDAAQRLAALLGRSDLIDETTLSSTAAEVAPAVIERMQSAIHDHEDSQLLRELLEVLVRLDGLVPLQADEVRAVYQMTRGRLTDASKVSNDQIIKDEGAAVRDMGHLTGTLISRRLSPSEGRELLGEFLSSIDDDRFGNKIVKVIYGVLIGVGNRDPEAVAWMEDLFGGDGVANAVQLAIARAILQIDGHHVGGRASRLKDRPDCPPEVATYIITRLLQ